MITQNHLAVLIDVLNRAPATLAERMVIAPVVEHLQAELAPQGAPQAQDAPATQPE